MENVKSDSTRVALAEAIQAREDAARLVFRARQSEERSRQLCDEEQAKLTAYADVDAAISDFRISKFKQAAEAGEDLPKHRSLPTNLLSRGRARDEIKLQVAAAVSAHKSFVAEREKAEQAVARADRKITWLIIQIVTAEANAQGERARLAWNAAFTSYDCLHAYCSTWVPYESEGMKSLRVNRETTMTLTHIAGFDHRQFPGATGNRQLTAFMNQIKRWMTALAVNANAKFDEQTDERTKEKAA